MPKNIEAIILAGGRGARMGFYTDKTQKCLLPIDGKPMIGHTMDALSQSFDHVDLMLGVSYNAEAVKEFVEKHKASNITVTYVLHILGTEGYGIYKGMKNYIHGPFLAMPGDIIANPSILQALMERFDQGDCDAAIALATDTDEVDTHGVGRVKDGIVSELQWPPPTHLGKDDLRDMTIWASDQRIFDMLDRYPCEKKSIGHVFMAAVKNGKRIAGIVYDLPWIHPGYPEDLNKSLKTSERKRRDALQLDQQQGAAYSFA